MGCNVLMAIIGFLFLAQPCFAAKHKESMSSTDYLVQDLQNFKLGIAELENSNRQLVAYNHELKEHVELAKSQMESLNREQSVLEKDAHFSASKTQDKTSQLNTLDIQLNEVRDHVRNLEQEIAVQDVKIKNCLEHQRLIWEELANSQKENGASADELVSLSSVGILKEKVELTQKFKLKERYLSDLKKQLDEQLLLSADPTVSVPKLTAERDLLNKELLAANQGQVPLNKRSFDDSKLRKQLNFEVNELSRNRSELSTLLQMLQDQYDGNEKINKNSSEEKKLKDSIVILEKNRKFLMRQTADLRFEMVDLDKKRIQLEKFVNSVKK